VTDRLTANMTLINRCCETVIDSTSQFLADRQRFDYTRCVSMRIVGVLIMAKRLNESNTFWCEVTTDDSYFV